MHITLVMVSSLDGKITKHDNPKIASWTSPEDKKLFGALIKKSKLIVMGGKTYESVKHQIKLELGKLRIVMTRHPKKYRAVPGMLEFTSESPLALTKRLAKYYKTMLLVGGSEINALFLKAKLVDELHLTLEPLLFGTGKPIVSPLPLDTTLKLISLKKINARGTLSLVYTIS
ncbi:MAG: dihydrofolate reductase family protein [Patescibacteria group bacterium]